MAGRGEGYRVMVVVMVNGRRRRHPGMETRISEMEADAQEIRVAGTRLIIAHREARWWKGRFQEGSVGKKVG